MPDSNTSLHQEKKDEGIDPKGTAFIRDAGFACRKCGTQVSPQWTGNVLVCFYCPGCSEEFET